MKFVLGQKVIDLLRLKNNFIKNYLNDNPLFLKFIMNIFSLLPNHGNKQKIKLLKFCGAKVADSVGIGENFYVYQPKNLILDDFVGIADNTTMRCWDKVHIGKYTFLAINSVFIPGGHRTDNYENLINQEIYIGPGCWIGANCTIMGGTKILKGSIVGAGTVVRGQEYPSFSIIAGVPGKVIKKRLPQSHMNIPQEYNIEELQDYA
jgi:acetyltransferase-like isoleucine patch superfamily enzyme